MTRSPLFVFLLTTLVGACSGSSGERGDAGGDGATADAASDATPTEDAAPEDASDAQADSGPDGAVLPIGLYRGTCDGSAGVWLDATRFLSFDDESQTWRVFVAGVDGAAVQSGSFAASIGVTGEADVEDATLVGSRVYAITSHGRNKNGDLQQGRYRFFAFDVSGSAPSATLTFAGSTSTLLQAMLDESNFTNGDEDVTDLLIARSKLEDPEEPSLAPKVNGTAIEGLSVLPDGVTLAIGFRNPQILGHAIVVTLTNASDVLEGEDPVFGRVIRMDLGGLGVRGMTYDAERATVWIIAGPCDSASSPFRLYRWTGVHTDAPVEVLTLTPPTSSGPEVVLPIAGTDTLRVLYDQGSLLYAGTECKELPPAAQRFTDTVVTVP